MNLRAQGGDVQTSTGSRTLPSSTGGKRMPADRCALLMAAAVHAGLEEVWLAPQPILFFVYVAQYLRGLYFLLSPRLGKQRVEGFKGGKIGYNSLSISAALGGAKGVGEGDKKD